MGAFIGPGPREGIKILHMCLSIRPLVAFVIRGATCPKAGYADPLLGGSYAVIEKSCERGEEND